MCKSWFVSWYDFKSFFLNLLCCICFHQKSRTGTRYTVLVLNFTTISVFSASGALLFTSCFSFPLCQSSSTDNTIMMLGKTLCCSHGGLLSLHLLSIKRWLLFPRRAPVVSEPLFVCAYPERQTGFLQLWPSVTHARCYIFTSPFWLSCHIQITSKQCLSAIAARRSLRSPWTFPYFVTLRPQTSMYFL